MFQVVFSVSSGIIEYWETIMFFFLWNSVTFAIKANCKLGKWQHNMDGRSLFYLWINVRVQKTTQIIFNNYEGTDRKIWRNQWNKLFKQVFPRCNRPSIVLQMIRIKLTANFWIMRKEHRSEIWSVARITGESYREGAFLTSVSLGMTKIDLCDSILKSKKLF